MAETTYEEASRCPKCNELGELATKTNLRDGASLHVFLCRNERCRWFGQTCRVVEVNPDGTIPTPTGHRKRFPALPKRSDEEVERSNAAILNATLDGRETR